MSQGVEGQEKKASFRSRTVEWEVVGERLVRDVGRGVGWNNCLINEVEVLN